MRRIGKMIREKVQDMTEEEAGKGWAGATRMYVPKIGVSDGIVRELYHQRFKSMMEVVH